MAGAFSRRRPTDDAETLVINAFAAAWYAGSLVIFLPTARTMLAIAGIVDPTFHTALDLADNVALATALGSLMYYLLYIVTGHHGLWRWIGGAYAGYLVYLDWYTLGLGQRTLVVGSWQAELRSENTPTPIQSLIFGLLLALPILFMVGTYGVLAFQTKDPSQRYRIGMIAGAFLLLFACVLLSYALHLDVEPWFPLTYELPGFFAAAMIVAAFRPPGWVRAWLRVNPVSTTSARPDP